MGEKLYVSVILIINYIYITYLRRMSEAGGSEIPDMDPGAVVTLEQQMDDSTRESERPDMGACYKQCSTAREASIKIAKTDIALNGHFKNNGLGGYTSIGRFDCTEDKDVLNTFHGVRFTKGQQTVNECIWQLSRAPPAKTNTALLRQMVGHSQLSSVTRTLSRLSPRQTAAHVFQLLG